MSGVIKEDKYKNMMCVKDVLLSRIYIDPRSLIVLEPDFKYPNVCHVKHKSGRWFHLRQSVLEVQQEYCKAKRRLAKAKAEGG
jgi:hypothetical protein